MTQELLVENPVRVLFADVDVDHGTGEEPVYIMSVDVLEELAKQRCSQPLD
jgi:hypothetical protein